MLLYPVIINEKPLILQKVIIAIDFRLLGFVLDLIRHRTIYLY